MIGLGKPIRVCSHHIGAMNCPGGCLGVQLPELDELKAAGHTGCAVCRLAPRRTRPFRILRKCGRGRCYARFHKVSYDDFRVDEWREAWRLRISRIARLRPLTRRRKDDM